MKRYLFSIVALLFLAVLSANAQPIKQILGTKSTLVQAPGSIQAQTFLILPKPVAQAPDSVGSFRYNPTDSSGEVWTGTQWIKIGGSLFFDSRNPSTNTTISGMNGLVLGGLTVQQALQALLYPSQVPTAGLTATYLGSTSSGLNLEMRAAGSGTVTLNWSAGRQASTMPLSTITVNGSTQSFSQPAAPGSVSGTASTTLAFNTNGSYSTVVTTTDGKTATAAAYVSWYWKRYFGFVSSTSPTDGTIQALTNEFTGSRTRSPTSPLTPSGSQYFCIAFPESFDPSAGSEIWVGGLNQTGTFTRTVRSFQNASGGTTNYIIYTGINPTSGGVSFEIK